MLPDFIPDGYTRTVGFNATSLHGPFDFTYRPFRGVEADQAWADVLTSKTDDARKALLFATIAGAPLVAGRVLKWSYGRELSPEALNEMNPAAFAKLQGVVYGQRAPDWDETNPPEADKHLEAADAKNSNGE
jgi:hypothetical protein